MYRKIDNLYMQTNYRHGETYRRSDKDQVS